MILKHRLLMLTLAALVALAVAAPTRALGQVKVGVVDLQLALASTQEGKAAKEKLEGMTKKKQKALDDKVAGIKKMEDEMQKQMPLMSEAGKKDMLEKYRKAMGELQEMYVSNQTELAKEKAKVLEPILKKMSAIVQDIALSGSYTLILDKTDGTVLYNDPAIDLTSEVIRRYNAKK
jgi:outer membrane protein